MMQNSGTPADRPEEAEIVKEAFAVSTLEDHLRVDRLCQELLKNFYLALVAGGNSPEEASRLARGADYFVRDFVVDCRERNIFDERAGLVRQFAGNWYIVNTLEPKSQELSGYLAGIGAFYRYLHDRQLVSDQFLSAVEKECADLSYYERRIESFWAIEGDGYLAWERECSLKGGE